LNCGRDIILYITLLGSVAFSIMIFHQGVTNNILIIHGYFLIPSHIPVLDGGFTVPSGAEVGVFIHEQLPHSSYAMQATL